MPKKKKYEWEAGCSLPKIDNHSLVKLNIIEHYLEIYLQHLTKLFHVRSLRLAIVDGFAGGGLYEGGITGSPIRAQETIEKTKRIINFKRQQDRYSMVDFKIDYFFVEKDKKAFDFLQSTLNRRDISRENIQCINGEFAQNIDDIINEIKNRLKSERVIFMLDQYGYKDATIRDIRKIFLSLKKAEVILTFSTDSLIDYLCKKNISNLENIGFTKQQAEELLDIREDNNFARSKIQPLLYKYIVEQTQAPYYTPFFIKSDLSSRSYWLFHFSTHELARDEMMRLHWEHKNTFQHFGSAGLNMLLGYDTTSEHTLFEFDDFAQERTMSCLTTELPELIKAKIISRLES